MSKTLLFEIGTEEMPASAAATGVDQLAFQADALLREYRLKTDSQDAIVLARATPRRLVLIVRGLALNQESAEESVKGPPKRAAYTEDGAPTPAAVGFAKSLGAELDDLEIKEVDGGEYVFAVKKYPGLATEKVLPDLLTTLIKSLEFTKAMRWGSGQTKFIRPVRWLVALFGDKVVPVEFAGLVSGRQTFGHRFLAKGPFELATADDYEETLEKAKVKFSNAPSAELNLKGQIDAVAEAAGGRAAIDGRILHEVTYLVEDPHAVVGSFDKDFLKIPRQVLVTAMESHQRYFPIENSKGQLLPLFAVVHNGDPKHNDQIRRGHERVLRARLADAAFFFHEDTKTTLESKVDRLKDVVWQAKLGTVYEKTERSRRLADRIAGLIGLDDKSKKKIDRAILLAKADLTTSMVIEFTDLQGVVGKEYALVDGEEAEVAEAIKEHYQPRFADDEPPKTIVGQVAALVDKTDSVVGCFLAGLIPTGSTDPYSLRRQAAGIIGILSQSQWPIGIMGIVELAIDNYKEANVSTEDAAEIAAQLQEFIVARLKRSLNNTGAEPDTVDAVLAAHFDNVSEIKKRVGLIDGFRGKKELDDIKVAFTRCQNLVKDKSAGDVEESLFEKAEEKSLFDTALAAQVEMSKIVQSGNLEPAMNLLASMREQIDKFFDAVMVMAEDKNIRDNRLKLLNQVLLVSGQVADFSKML